MNRLPMVFPHNRGLSMPPIHVNRRRFLGCSATAALAISHGNLADAAGSSDIRPIRLGVIGVGTRGTALLRALLEIEAATVVAVCDTEAKHRQRGQGIVDKARDQRAEAFDDYRRILERADVDAVVAALPCDLHEDVYRATIQAGKHLYAEKPLGISLAACDRLIEAAEQAPQVRFQVGFQRRFNPRFQEGIDLIRAGELGRLVEVRASSSSSNGPMMGQGGWLGRRDRSGDWMIEHAVHVWDVLHWLLGSMPIRATGWGRRDLFADKAPGRDVTDHYSVELEWANGLRASFHQSWIAPANEDFTGSTLRVLGEKGGLDFNSGILTYRDRDPKRRSVQSGPQPDTRLSLQAFLGSIRTEDASVVVGPPSLSDARDATLIGLLVRKAVDERRTVSFEEMTGEDLAV
jgi:predicted dehydrogenase